MEAEREQPASTSTVLNERGLTVSTDHIAIASQRLSYPLQDVTSASARKEPARRLLPIGILVVGIVLGIWALTYAFESPATESATVRLDRFSDKVPLDTIGFGVPALMLITVGVMWLMCVKSVFTVVLHAPARTRQVLSDRDEQWVTRIVTAVNDAIAAR